MASLQAQLSEKKDKLFKYAQSMKKKEPNRNNLKTMIMVIRYTTKYLSKYASEFKDVFLFWVDIAKDFILRCEFTLQVQAMAQISMTFLQVLRIQFEPLSLIDDVLGAWIDFLIAMPIEVTSAIVVRNGTKLRSIITSLKTIGHFKYQALLVEVVNRYLLSMGDQLQPQAIRTLFGDESDAGREEMVQLFLDIDMNNLEGSVRLFLNQFNKSTDSLVSTYAVLAIQVGDLPLVPPCDLRGGPWVDLNRRGGSLSFYGSSDSSLWNLFEIPRENVVRFSIGALFTVCIELSSTMSINFCVDDESHKQYADATRIAIEFASAEESEMFLKSLTGLCMGYEEQLPVDNIDCNLSIASLNLSTISRSFHNGELDARFSFMGDDDADESVQPEAVVPVVPRLRSARTEDPLPVEPVSDPRQTRQKRKLYSHVAYAAESPPLAPASSPSSQGSLVIVMNEEDWPIKKIVPRPPANNLTQTIANPKASKKIFKTPHKDRVPIYRTILNDWKSDADSSSYTFVDKDLKVAPQKARTRRSTANAKTKKAAAGPVKRVTRASAKGNSVTLKRVSTALKKMPLDFVRKIIRRPCKEAAQEVKKLFGLNNTPPPHGRPENPSETQTLTVAAGDDHQLNESVTLRNDQMEVAEIEHISHSDATTLRTTTSTIEGVSMVVLGPEEATDESYAVFMRFIEEYRTLNMQMGDVMQGIRKLKTRIISSAQLTQYQKAGLLVELCNFLLKK